MPSEKLLDLKTNKLKSVTETAEEAKTRYWKYCRQKEAYNTGYKFTDSIFQTLEKQTVNSKIKAFACHVDRGIPCWSTFIKLLELKFPNIEALYVGQNYTYHTEEYCTEGCRKMKFNDYSKTIGKAFKKSRLKYLVIRDCQTVLQKLFPQRSLLTMAFRDDEFEEHLEKLNDMDYYYLNKKDNKIIIVERTDSTLGLLDFFE
jgi:hypothetical protein